MPLYFNPHYYRPSKALNIAAAKRRIETIDAFAASPAIFGSRPRKYSSRFACFTLQFTGVFATELIVQPSFGFFRHMRPSPLRTVVKPTSVFAIFFFNDRFVLQRFFQRAVERHVIAVL